MPQNGEFNLLLCVLCFQNILTSSITLVQCQHTFFPWVQKPTSRSKRKKHKVYFLQTEAFRQTAKLFFSFLLLNPCFCQQVEFFWIPKSLGLRQENIQQTGLQVGGGTGMGRQLYFSLKLQPKWTNYIAVFGKPINFWAKFLSWNLAWSKFFFFF